MDVLPYARIRMEQTTLKPKFSEACALPYWRSEMGATIIAEYWAKECEVNLHVERCLTCRGWHIKIGKRKKK